jgi:hypothetical protein
MSSNSQLVLREYRQLLRLIARIPKREQKAQMLSEARSTIRTYRSEANPAKQLDLRKLLAAKISFLRVVTPKPPGTASNTESGHFIIRDGNLVEGTGSTAGKRCVTFSLSHVITCNDNSFLPSQPLILTPFILFTYYIPCSVADGKVSMSEAYELHNKLLKRQHYGRKPPKYDPGTF